MITFRDFMEISLYDPKEGFYSRRVPREDFYTAPELHSAFAEVLADVICAKLEALAKARPAAPLFLMEMGSGDGRLARQILTFFRRRHPRWLSRMRVILVERVERVLLQSILDLQDTGARLLGYTRLEEVQPFCGVVYSNELIDAMPVHVLEKKDGRVRELYVRRGAAPERAEKTELGLLSSRALVHAARAVAPSMDEGQRHAVNLEANSWLLRVSRLLKAGSVITIDYGKRFDPGTPNPPRSFFRHTVGDDLSARPGRQDLTSSVDFSQLMREGERCGLKTAEFMPLGKFLLEHGILNRLPAGGGVADVKERNQIKTLFHPDGMGERFKVLIQEKDD
ncbi:MAG: SAM-dependent methyltransferase [Elusimicrobiota bacterium]